METSNKRESGFTHDSVGLLYSHFQKIEIIRIESYIVSPDWIASKKATIHPKNEKDNECFKWSKITGLNYNKIKEKELKKLLKFRRVDINYIKETGESLNKKILRLFLISYFYHIIVKK